MRFLTALVLGVFLFAGSAFAETCAHSKSGDNASVLMDASKALEASNPELAGKVKAIADNCCKLGLHEGGSAESKHEHPAAHSSEHPSDHPTS